ncbi:MAG: ABC-2 family transporter protein [Chloroflexi bacterium]|nr:ABC-2 family transporter protein [Chloroflexota bacterium]
MIRHAALYARLVGARGRGQMQYRLSFATLVLASVLVTLAEFLVVVVIFGRIPHLAGWSLGEVAVLYGLSAISFAMAEMFAAGFDVFPRQIVQGTFDRVLTRPLGAFFQVLASELALRKIGKVAQGAAILVYAQHSLAVHWSPERLVVLALTVVSGTAIFFSLIVICATSCFWTVQANEAVNVLTNGGTAMISYPLDIYHAWLRRLATFVVPLAFVSYYPALYVLDRADPLGLPAWVGFLSPVAAAAFGFLAWTVWSVGVRHYQGTGS